MTYLAILFALTTGFYWWRTRTWKRRYQMMLQPQVAVLVGDFSKIWADGFRDSMRTDNWPEEIHSRYE